MSRPPAPHPFAMSWRAGSFLHWPFDPARIRPHVPPPLELDTFDGRAWVSVLPFVLANAGPRYTPSFARLTVPELNVRTYVRFDGTPGLYFFSIDVAHPAVPAVVGGATRLPCYHAEAHVRRRDEEIEFRSVRTHPGQARARLHVSYRPDGERFVAEHGTLDYWLAERRRMFDPAGEDVLYAAIAHDPWPLRPPDATIRENELFEANDLPTPDREPRVRYCDRLEMTVSIPRWVHGLDGDCRIQPRRLASG